MATIAVHGFTVWMCLCFEETQPLIKTEQNDKIKKLFVISLTSLWKHGWFYASNKASDVSTASLSVNHTQMLQRQFAKCWGTKCSCTKEAEVRSEFTRVPSSGHCSEWENVQHTNTRIAFAELGSVLVMCAQSWDSVVTRGRGRKEGWALLPLPLGLAGRTGRDFYTRSLNKHAHTVLHHHSSSQWPIQNPFK